MRSEKIIENVLLHSFTSRVDHALAKQIMKGEGIQEQKHSLRRAVTAEAADTKNINNK